MIASLMVYALIVGTMVAGAAVLLDRAARLIRAPARWVWASAFALLLGIVAIAPERSDRGPWRVTVETSASTNATEIAPRAQAPLANVRHLIATSIERLALGVHRFLPAKSDLWLGALWLASSAVALGVMIAVFARLRRARRRWPVAVLHGAPVRVAPDGGPAVIGLARPEIIIPQWLLGCTADEQRLVLVHEREHVRARDHLLLIGGCLTVALLPWHPAAWWMLARLRLAVELDCDARVLRRGVAPHSYGALLIDLAGRCTRLPVGAPALADESSHLTQRLVAMKPAIVRFASVRSVSLAALALVGLIAACESRLPTAAEIEAMDVAAAESQMKIPLLLKGDSGEVIYFVDGVVASKQTVHAMLPEDIAMIEVERGDGGEHSSVAVTTRAFIAKQQSPGDTAGGHFRIRVGDPPGEQEYKVRIDSTPAKMAVRRFDGLVVLNGKIVSENIMATLDPSRILSVEVVKGDAGARLYPGNEEAGRGVIRITTKP